MNNLEFNRKKCFSLTLLFAFVFSLGIQTNAFALMLTFEETPTDGIECTTTQIYYPNNYKVGAQREKDCAYCKQSTVGVEVRNSEGEVIGIKYTITKVTVRATTVDCVYLPDDDKAYCTQVLLAGGITGDCPTDVTVGTGTGTGSGTN